MTETVVSDRKCQESSAQPREVSRALGGTRDGRARANHGRVQVRRGRVMSVLAGTPVGMLVQP